MENKGEDDRFLELANLSCRVNDSALKVIKLCRGGVKDWRGDDVPFVYGSITKGLTVKEYWYGFAPARAAGFAKIIATPSAGYLSRRLVTAMRDITIVEGDCGNTKSVLYCTHGKLTICTTCARRMDATQSPCNIGVIAAQALGEISTQKSMKVKHATGTLKMSVRESFTEIEKWFELRTDALKETLKEQHIEQQLDTIRLGIMSVLPVKPLYIDVLLYAMTSLNTDETITLSDRSMPDSWELLPVKFVCVNMPNIAARFCYSLTKSGVKKALGGQVSNEYESRVERIISGGLTC